jgi:hypothetical protein
MTKKSSSKTKQPLKLTQIQAHAEHQRRHRMTLGVGIIIIAILLALVLVLVVVPHVRDTARLQRINQIYASIPLPSTVYDEKDTIFGEKRPYEWDAGRSYSSSKTFVVGKNVDETFALLDKEVRAAGFTFIGEPYPGSTSLQYHYKNDKGEYVRLDVSSKVRNDAFQNELWMKKDLSNEFFAIDPNAGPSMVTLKVNLDDNNE